MGLTIHYRLAAPKIKSFDDALALLRRLHAQAKTLGVEECSKILTWEEGKDDPAFARLFHFYKPIGKSKTKLLDIPPQRFAVFALTQQGSEPAWFGLALFHKKAPATHDPDRLRPTGLAGFHWNTFCKTQYASMTQHGGFPNFFKIHDAICRTLDFAKKLGFKIEVFDEGHYFKKRDPAVLESHVNQMNALVAAFTGRVKDAMGPGTVAAPITTDPAYEHLEAKGQKLLKGKISIHRIIRSAKRKK
jgi:hypothetical protein